MVGAWNDKTRTLEYARLCQDMELPAERPTLHGNNIGGLLWLFTAAEKVDARDPVWLIKHAIRKAERRLSPPFKPQSGSCYV